MHIVEVILILMAISFVVGFIAGHKFHPILRKELRLASKFLSRTANKW